MTDLNQSPSSTQSDSRLLPIALRVGFAGSRVLFDSTKHLDVDGSVVEAAVEQELQDQLSGLLRVFDLDSRYFLCAASQIAIGADTAFCRACQSLNIPHELLLPQHLDTYLTAQGSDGPDFSTTQHAVALQLSQSPNVVRTQVAAHSHSRRDRFQEVTYELANRSDVLIGVVRADAKLKQGGTLELVDAAQKYGKPLLRIDVGIDDGVPVLKSRWIDRDKFVPPPVPDELITVQVETASGNSIPTSTEYCQALKTLASKRARNHRIEFKTIAITVILAHLLATLGAVSALAGEGLAFVPIVLIVEVALLLLGLRCHYYLHNSEACKRWALFRLCSEVARSINALDGIPIAPDYLFWLTMPQQLRPVLNTVAILHLRSATRYGVGSLKDQKLDYIGRRLEAPKAQIDYYHEKSEGAEKQSKLASWAFYGFSTLSIMATLSKLLFLALVGHSTGSEWVPLLLGAMAVVFPVAAVGGLSLAAAFDLEARRHQYSEMHTFLRSQVDRIMDAPTESEFHRRVVETEVRLLGETANWYARRAFTGVS